MHYAAWLLIGVSLAACTADPDAPINQTTPIRQMDRFFNGLSGREPPPEAQYAPPPRDYSRGPGYAPAYPPYERVR